MTNCVVTVQPVEFHPVSSFNWKSEWEKRLQLLDTMDEISLDPVKNTRCSFFHLGRPKEYLVLSREKEISYTMFEESNSCCRHFCRYDRPFAIHVRDKNEQDVLLIRHEFQCCALWCCSGCCRGAAERVTVSTPNGDHFGTVAQDPGCCYFSLDVYENHGDCRSFQIVATSGVCCNNQSCGQDAEFKILNPDGRQIGAITFRWTGVPLMAWLFNAPYTISVTEKVTARQKALFMAAAILMEYVFFDPQRDARYALCCPPYIPTS